MTSNADIDPGSIVARIIAEIEDQPAVRPLLLRTLLTEEFLAMPARMLRLEEKLEGFQAEVNERFDRMDGRFDRMDDRFDRMEGTQDRMSGQLSNLMGSRYERKAIRRAPRLINRFLGLHNGEVIVAINRQNGKEITDLVNRATVMSVITDVDADELDEADIILEAVSAQDQQAYVVAEVSITIDEDDISRARERADTLQLASGTATHAAVIGSAISPANRQNAQSSRVTVIDLRE